MTSNIQIWLTSIDTLILNYANPCNFLFCSFDFDRLCSISHGLTKSCISDPLKVKVAPHLWRSLPLTWADQERGQRVQIPPGKSQMAIGFVRNSGTDLLEKQVDPSGPIASRGRYVLTSVKYVDE